ncbi:MAG: formate/nitrite transporter family protein [Treponema sp.]|nr:formate/nitrite transporter family protein [Treponema sp.]
MNSPADIAENYVDIGFGKSALPFWRMLVLAIFAGAFIAFGAVASSVSSCGVQPAPVSRLLGAAVFPVGLMLVLVAGAELFTGNCLLIVPVLERESSAKLMFRNWAVVYVGNLIGSLLIAFTVVYADTFSLYDGKLAEFVVTTAVNKVKFPFVVALLRGVLCNMLVCLAVWVAFSADELAGKIISLYMPIFLFVLCGFEHCVANMYFIPAGILAAARYGINAEGLNWGTFFLRNLLPVTLGNIIGGMVIIGIGYWFVYLKKDSH